MSRLKRAAMTSILVLHALIFMLVVAEVIKTMLFRDWEGLAFPIAYMWILIWILSKDLEKLKEKRVFVVLKDKNW